MIHVTQHARDALLNKKRLANIADPDVGLRLASSPDGKLGLVADRQKAGDEVVRHKDSTVLLVDPGMSALVLRGRTVDCRQSDDGQEEIVLRWDTTQA
jgi:hypothetical protein